MEFDELELINSKIINEPIEKFKLALDRYDFKPIKQ